MCLIFVISDDGIRNEVKDYIIKQRVILVSKSISYALIKIMKSVTGNKFVKLPIFCLSHAVNIIHA